MPEVKRQSLLTLDSQSREWRPYRRWYFAFCKNETELPWWQKLFVRKDPPHLRHTYAFTQMGAFVLFVEPHRDKVEFTLKHPIGDDEAICAELTAMQLVDEGHTVVRHEYIPSISGVKSIWNWIPSCVTVVKAATGYSSFALSPRQLLHCLLKNGAYIILKGDVRNG
jgi:hypothetical protein